MDVKERKHNAVSITRELLMDAFDHPMAIIRMTVDCTKPEDVENQVAMILKYLEKTKPNDIPGAVIFMMKPKEGEEP